MRPMKKTLRFLTLGIATLIGIAAFSMPVFAQDDAAKKTDDCNKIYNDKFLAHYKTDQAQAYLDGKEYLQQCAGVEAKIEDYIKKWVKKYEWAKLKADFDNAFAGNDYPNVYKYGKEIVGKTPEQMAELVELKVATGNENVATTIKLGYAGYNAEAKGKVTSYRGDATNYAKQAIQLLESGKAPDKWEPFKDKDEALAWLNFSLGYMAKESTPKDSAAYFYKTFNFNSSLKNSAATYIYISPYYSSEYLKINQAIKTKCEGVPEDNAECKALDEQQDAWMDRWADTLARALSIAPNDPGAAEWRKTLESIFKNRYNLPDDNAAKQAVNEYVAKVQSKPLPDPATEPKPEPVREVIKDASTSGAKTTGTVSNTTTTSDVAVGNGNGTTAKMNGANGATTTNAAKTTPAKKAPAKGKAKKPTR